LAERSTDNRKAEGSNPFRPIPKRTWVQVFTTCFSEKCHIKKLNLIL